MLRKLATCREPDQHIMLHYASICLDPVFLIVLPLAKYGNLGHFLYGRSVPGLGSERGYRNISPHPLSGSESRSKYMKEQLQHDILLQTERLAGALRWLHKARQPLVDTREHRFVHLDIKPENILVLDKSDLSSSSVGFWVISDFGSMQCACPEEVLLTTTGAISRPTDISISAKRWRDEYTAPELMEYNSLVGQRSDVWSLACVVVEIMTFVLSRETKTVKAFQSKRLKKPWHTIMPIVDHWLTTLIRDFDPATNGWVECCVTRLKKYFVLIDSRPDSTELQHDIEHIVKHYENQTTDFGAYCRDMLQNPTAAVPTGPPVPLRDTITQRHDICVEQTLSARFSHYFMSEQVLHALLVRSFPLQREPFRIEVRCVAARSDEKVSD